MDTRTGTRREPIRPSSSSCPIRSYDLSQRNTFITNPDGSVDLYLQAESPGKAKESNWLASPAQDVLGVIMRLYAPKARALDGRWVPPAIKRVP